MSTSRVSGTISKPFVHGSAGFLLTKDELITGSVNTHKWTVYFRGFENEDTSTYIQSVTFKLHESFDNPVRTLTTPPFEVSEHGWGEFNIEIHIAFYPDAEISPVVLNHFLRLFPDERDKKDKVSKRPVISEVYDEFVFVNPTATFYQRLIAPPQLLPASLLSAYFTTSSLKEYNDRQMIRLNTAHEYATAQINTLLSQLYCLDLEADIFETILTQGAAQAQARQQQQLQQQQQQQQHHHHQQQQLQLQHQHQQQHQQLTHPGFQPEATQRPPHHYSGQGQPPHSGSHLGVPIKPEPTAEYHQGLPAAAGHHVHGHGGAYQPPPQYPQQQQQHQHQQQIAHQHQYQYQQQQQQRQQPGYAAPPQHQQAP